MVCGQRTWVSWGWREVRAVQGVGEEKLGALEKFELEQDSPPRVREENPIRGRTLCFERVQAGRETRNLGQWLLLNV